MLPLPFFADEVEKIFSNQCSGANALMQELTGKRDIDQLAHQAIYLKNMIGAIIGLQYELRFDQHTGVLCDALIAKSRDELLEAFCRHMPLQMLSPGLVTMTNTPGSARLFKQQMNAFRDDFQEGRDWKYGKDDITVEYTDNALLTILKQMGYLNVSK